MSAADARPDTPTAAILAEHLSLSNEHGQSWFTYELGDQPATIRASLYDSDGNVEKAFTIWLDIEEDEES